MTEESFSEVYRKLELLVLFIFLSLVFAVSTASAAEPVLFSQGNSYDTYVNGNYIIYTDYSDDPYGRVPGWHDHYHTAITRGKGNFIGVNSIGNIYLYNISSNKTIPVYKSGWRSGFPWIENDTIYWYESTMDYIVFKDDPTPRDIYLYSVPFERLSYEASENHSLLNPNITVAREHPWEFLELKRPDYSTEQVEVVQAEDGTSDLFMYYNDSSSGNRTLIASGFYINYANPQIYNGRIFWEDCRSGYLQIYVFDIRSGREYQVAPQEFAQYDCSVDGDIVSWTTYGGDLYYINISDLIEKEEPEDTGNNLNPESGPETVIFPAAILISVAIFARRGRK
ncbi:MAG: hypothetical protein JW931_07335 [Methanomicrobiaceae archaeon]|nr:hypothetical protein [Methanomicrobiaceae archaeon]